MNLTRLSLLLLIALACGGRALAFDGTAKPESSARSVYGWFGFDVDNTGPQLWLGASKHVAGPLAIASTLWLGLGTGSEPALGEFAMGPELNIDDTLTVTLQLGVGFDFGARQLQYLSAPQLFITADLKPIWLEAWNFVYLYGPFHGAYDRPPGSVPQADTFAGRYALLYELSPSLAIGPQLELAVAFKRAAANDLNTLTSLPLGLRVSLGHGPASTFGLFIGYDTQHAPATAGTPLVGRLSYIHAF